MMKTLAIAVLATSMSFGATSVHEFTLESIDGKTLSFSDYKGKVLLLVNVASRCGFTRQYAGLQSLYAKHRDKGLVVVGIPANNFGGQEPGTNDEIKQFCSRTYNVTFPMTKKVSVKGSDMTPLYGYLTSAQGGDVKWNFTKFLIGKDGKVIGRFEPKVAPDSTEMTAAIEKALSQ